VRKRNERVQKAGIRGRNPWQERNPYMQPPSVKRGRVENAENGAGRAGSRQAESRCA